MHKSSNSNAENPYRKVAKTLRFIITYNVMSDVKQNSLRLRDFAVNLFSV
jgi:hypothetical protein